MKSHIKKLVLVCLIFLQLIAPFIHAHAFGLDSAQEHVLHVHSLGEALHNHTLGSDLKIHIAEFNQQESIETAQVIGTIFKVASGVKRNLVIDIDALLLACVLVFGLFIRIDQEHAPASDSLYPHQRFYSPHSPRAPPR